MEEANVPAGLMVIAVPPVPVTFELPTGIDSNVESSLVFLIRILPVSTSTFSLKFRTIFAFSPTPVALSLGVEEDKVGAMLSPVTKLSAVAPEIPAYELVAASSNAVAGIKT